MGSGWGVALAALLLKIRRVRRKTMQKNQNPSALGLTRVKFPQYSGYDEYLDDAGNKVYWDKKTKQWVECVNTDMPMGGRVSLPRQVEAQDKYVAAQQTREYNRSLSFYFALSKDRRQETIRPQTLARLFFAASYLRPNDNRLYSPDGNLMEKKELNALMRLKSYAFKDFWREVDGKYIFPQEDGSLKICSDFFRGTLIGCNRTGVGSGAYQRVFIKSLRELFWQTAVTKHRYLGYLFMILHQISWEYNVLCWNPQEQDRSKVETMSLDDFCKSMGADGHTEDQRQRLLDAYRALKFNIDNTEQYLVAYLEDHISGKFYLVLNPNLLYRGHDRRQVDGFGSFFPDLTTRTARTNFKLPFIDGCSESAHDTNRPTEKERKS